MSAMTPKMKAAWRKMVGAALLWFALAALAATTTTRFEGRGVLIATAGFVAFALGLALLTDGMKREIVDDVRRGN